MKTLWRGTSAYNQSIWVVELEGNRIALRFAEGKENQSLMCLDSPDTLELPYVSAMASVLECILKPGMDRVLTVGLGGGSLSQWLQRRGAINQDVVEIDEGVVHVARQFFGYQGHVHIEDGRTFLERHGGPPYDVIVCDAFGAANSTPSRLCSVEWCKAALACLNPGRGFLVQNLWGLECNPSYLRCLQAYRETFAQVNVLHVPGSENRIVIASREQNACDWIRGTGNIKDHLMRSCMRSVEQEFEEGAPGGTVVAAMRD